MESGKMMLLHSVIIALVAYGIMRYMFNQSPEKAEDRSILLLGLVVVYMVLFGHALPVKVNKNIY